jgi:hypothetical protein
VIVGTYAASDLLATDRTARAGTRLLRTFDGLNPVSKFAYQNFVDQFTTDILAAAEQGDLRSDVRPEDVTESLVTSILGIEVLSSAVANRTDMRERFTRLWNVVLPAVVTADVLDEYRAILAAASVPQTGSIESDTPEAHIAN